MDTHAEKWKFGLARTRNNAFGKIASLLGIHEFNDETWENLEALFIQADIGMETTQFIIESLKQKAAQEGWIKTEKLKSEIRIALESLIPSSPSIELNLNKPTIILVVGVNGSGKTTSIGKLAKTFLDEGHKVVLAAGDTYRAAAIEQLENWGRRLNIRVISGQPEGDPGAVTYDAVKSILARGEDILLIDTAGRLHNRYNLMEELKKVYRVAGKALPGAPHHVWLVMDATTGQNAIQQASAFRKAVNVSGIILAKLDSSAKGGMAFAIYRELGLPILFAGLGEDVEDLQPFDREKFVSTILTDFE